MQSGKGSSVVIENLSRFDVVIKTSEKQAKVIWSSLCSNCSSLVTRTKLELSEFQWVERKIRHHSLMYCMICFRSFNSKNNWAWQTHDKLVYCVKVSVERTLNSSIGRPLLRGCRTFPNQKFPNRPKLRSQRFKILSSTGVPKKQNKHHRAHYMRI